MKKIIALILISVISMSLFACGKKDTTIQDIDKNGVIIETNNSNPEDNNQNTVDEGDLSPSPTNDKITQEVVLYFPDSDLISTYRVKQVIEADSYESLPKAALEAWVRGTENEGLTNLVKPNVIIEYVEDVDGIAHVSFSKEIKESNLGSTGELLLIEQVSMIMQQFGFDQTQLLIEGQIEESLLGHLYIADPITANDPSDYTWLEDMEKSDIVVQNVAFRIFEPAPDAIVGNRIVVKGVARVFEASLNWEFEDGHNVLASGYVMASEGAPGWGEFEIIIEFDKVTNDTGTIIIYETSAKDGSRINEIIIPVKVDINSN
ncbi:MAG: Lipoprotein LpqB, GerMN domain [Clostridiales bacterium]|jgi:spore germination protein GerM|nr:Lipoprotein LpqB, GerMN domain [Clostridiales bacterium]